jgi:hypothetical protein
MQIQAQAALDQRQQQTTATLEQAKSQHAAALAQQRFELDRQMALLSHELAVRDQQFQHARQVVTAAVPPQGDGPGVGDAAAGSGQPQGGGNLAPLVLQLTQLLHQANAPKRVVRDGQGRVVGIEPVLPSAPSPMAGQ